MIPRTIDVSRVALKRRRTKIVATVGPASSTPERLEQLVRGGVDVFRVNMSHGTHETHATEIARIRAAAKAAGKRIAILVDLCGPKIRAGRFEGGSITLEPGQRVTVTTRDVLGKPGLIPSEYKALAKDVKPGDRILLNDGRFELRVEAIAGDDVVTTVVHGGVLSDKKGINLPRVNVSAPALTDKDRVDAEFALEHGADYIALSFVRTAADLKLLRDVITAKGQDTPIIAKIEKPEALDHIGEILENCEAIMVARGDLGVEMAAEEVPLIQRELIRVAIEANRPVIVATQMLESMIDNPTPTRAEVSDVASAAWAGTDAVMLSAETAAGKYPLEAVATMDRVLRMIEGYLWKHGQFGRLRTHDDNGAHQVPIAESLSRASSQVSRDLSVRSIIVPTRSGATALMVSAERPAAPVLAATESDSVCRRAALYWGVTPVLVGERDLDDAQALARRIVRELDLAQPGHKVIVLSDFGQSGKSPSLAVVEV